MSLSIFRTKFVVSEVNSNEDEIFKEFDLIIPVFHKTKPLAFLLIGDIINEAIQISPIIKHLPFIQTFTNPNMTLYFVTMNTLFCTYK